eukprot:augustus_masked-scaffold_37-processed-gene-2.15-mRNA-1 protein AED:0.05 eAED:0.05 QI:0/0/0/1/1/1/2/0/757
MDEDWSTGSNGQTYLISSFYIFSDEQVVNAETVIPQATENSEDSDNSVYSAGDQQFNSTSTVSSRISYPIHTAVLDNDLETFKSLLSKINQESKQTDTLDETNVEREQNETVNLRLLRLEQRNEDGLTPLHLIILSGNLEFLKILVDIFQSEELKDFAPTEHGPVLHLCLHVAAVPARKGAGLECFQSLLKLKKDKEVLLELDDLNRNLFHTIAEFNLKEAFLVLNENLELEGANLDALLEIEDIFGLNPVQVALKNSSEMYHIYTSMASSNPQAIKTPKIQNSFTAIISHPSSLEHKTHHPESQPPSENPNRVRSLLSIDSGTLRSSSMNQKVKYILGRKAEIGDILRVHDWMYVKSVRDYYDEIGQLDGDTAVSQKSFEAALYAAGSTCLAVDLLMKNSDSHENKRRKIESNSKQTGKVREPSDFDEFVSADGVDTKIRNVFCCVRPPGHHSGVQGKVCGDDANDVGSHGFCLLNNVAIGASYAMNMFRDKIRKVAIVDFDVHHGNGTEDCVRKLVPWKKKVEIKNDAFQRERKIGPFGYNLGENTLDFSGLNMEFEKYKPWLNENDKDNVMFVSVHGFGLRMPEMNKLPEFQKSRFKHRLGTFYPHSGRTFSNLEEGERKEPLIVDVGRENKDREEWRKDFEQSILPALDEFDPDLIFISAGFDAHEKDEINMGYIGLTEAEYYWITSEIVKVANKRCEGRVISVLEGGYKINCGVMSSFAKSGYFHVKALMETNKEDIYEKPPEEEQVMETEG